MDESTLEVGAGYSVDTQRLEQHNSGLCIM